MVVVFFCVILVIMCGSGGFLYGRRLCVILLVFLFVVLGLIVGMFCEVLFVGV